MNRGANRYKNKEESGTNSYPYRTPAKGFLHKESKKIANSYDIVCIENLNMKEMSQDMHFGKECS